MKPNRGHKLLFILTGFLLVILSLNRAQKHSYGHHRHALYGDKGGYYSYLPFFLHYGGEAALMPDSLAAKTGSGFRLEDGKLITKYPLGVAAMELPFFTLASFYSTLTSQSAHAYQNPYLKFAVLAPPFYVCIGLYLLFKCLLFFRLNIRPALLLSLFTLFATPLFYYTTVEGLMSHSFSFSLLAAFCYGVLRLFASRAKWRHRFFLALIIGLIALVRPLNVLFLPLIFLALVFMFKIPTAEILQKLKGLWPYGLVSVLVFSPQLLYYQYAFDSWLVYPYGEEGFRWADPQLMKMFFSTASGLFTYAPAFLLLFGASLVNAVQRPREFGLLGLGLLGISYLFSAWHSWSFGCGLGIRPFVDLLPILIFPLAASLKNYAKLNRLLFYLGLVLVVFNLWLSFRWKGCWFGEALSYPDLLAWIFRV